MQVQSFGESRGITFSESSYMLESEMVDSVCLHPTYRLSRSEAEFMVSELLNFYEEAHTVYRPVARGVPRIRPSSDSEKSKGKAAAA